MNKKLPSRYRYLFFAGLFLMIQLACGQLSRATTDSKPASTQENTAPEQNNVPSPQADESQLSPTALSLPPTLTPKPDTPWTGSPLTMTGATGEIAGVSIFYVEYNSVHAAWAVKDEQQNLYRLYYEFGGMSAPVNWSDPELAFEEPFQNDEKNLKIEVIADNGNHPHIFWNGNGQIRHIFQGTNGWESLVMSTSTPPSQEAMRSFDVVSQSGFNLHLIWEDQEKIIDSTYTSRGEWVYPEQVNYPDYKSACENIGDIAATDGGDETFVAWEDCGQVWVKTFPMVQLADNALPHVDIAVGPQDWVHVIWQDQNGDLLEMDRSPEETWSKAYPIFTGITEEISQLSLAMIGEDQWILFWSYANSPDPLHYMTRRQGEAWSEAASLPGMPNKSMPFAIQVTFQGFLHFLLAHNEGEQADQLTYAIVPFQDIALPEKMAQSSLAPAAPVSFPLVTGRADRRDLSIGGDWITWSEKGEDWDLYAANIETGEKILVSSQPEDQINPVTDGNVILWEDHQDYLPKIHVFDLQTRQERLLISRDSPQWTPDLDGEKVVYTACTCMNGECEIILVPFTYTKGYLCDREIWATDLSANEYRTLVQGLRSSHPHLSGNWLTWIQSLDEGGQIMGALNLDVSAEPQTIEASRSPSGTNIRQDGPIIVWVGTQGNQIWAYNLDTQQQTSVLFSPNEIGDPDISGEIVVWADNRSGNMDIFGFNLGTGEEFPICLEAGDQTSPRIEGNWVVWFDGRFNSGEIYGAQLAIGEP